MLRVKTYVAPSAIAGNGLFAAEPIAKGATIWKFDAGFDQVIDLRYLVPATEVVRQFVLTYAYQTIPDEPVFTLCVDNARFMNHSEDPNALDNFEGTFALRDIAVGEEIICSYSAFDARYQSKNPLWPDD